MQSRRQFVKIIFGFIATLISIKYFKTVKAVESLPYHHLSDGTFRNLPGSPKREISSGNSSRNFFRFFYKGIIKREMFDQKEIPDNIPSDHVLTQEKTFEQFHTNTDTISIRRNITIDVLLKYLRKLKSLPEQTDRIFVTDKMDKYYGFVSVNDLLVADPAKIVSEIMTEDKEVILSDTNQHEVARKFENADLVSAAVVDHEGILLGRITIDDVVDVIREEADESVLNMAGLKKDDDIFAPIIQSTKRRVLWLGANLITALLAAASIGLFEATIEKIVALAILMPIVASMGGIAGSQSLALVIRAQALDQIGYTNSKSLILKESAIGFLNGLLWSSVVALLTYLWFGRVDLGLVIAAALMINLVIGAVSGVGLPLILTKLNIDPALAGGVILTTITDVVGFISLLGIATLMI